MSDTDNLIARLKKERGNKGTSQREIADRMSSLGHNTWRQSTAAKVENGHRPLSFQEAVDLANVLGIDVADFFGLSDRPAPAWYMTAAYACCTCDFITLDRLAILHHSRDHIQQSPSP